jgi:hypothetical protein
VLLLGVEDPLSLGVDGVVGAGVVVEPELPWSFVESLLWLWLWL